ncbi:MAG: ABC transporter ATP-binding protein [Elusimicrobiota bacterium]
MSEALLKLSKITKIYKTNEIAFLSGLGDVFDNARHAENLREALSFKKLMAAYQEIKVTAKAKRREFLDQGSVRGRAEYLRDLVYKQNEFAVSALLDVDLVIHAGEMTALAGPSGSGKSTLLNIIATLEEPTSGSVVFEGRDLGGMGEDQRADFRLANLGFVFQAFNLIPVLSAYENVEYALILKGLPYARRQSLTREVLEYVGLKDCMHRRPNRLSGGQQQRVAIARAAAVAPKLILADEPTANLDSKTAVAILDLMDRVNKEMGTTIIYSSHDPLVLARARRAVHLRDGEVVKDEICEGRPVQLSTDTASAS